MVEETLCPSAVSTITGYEPELWLGAKQTILLAVITGEAQADPLTLTVAPLLKKEPFNVIEVIAPAGIGLGLIPERVGAGIYSIGSGAVAVLPLVLVTTTSFVPVLFGISHLITLEEITLMFWHGLSPIRIIMFSLKFLPVMVSSTPPLSGISVDERLEISGAVAGLATTIGV
jgi:hypothetical protein